jgi:secreted trypsin-like serine protease
VAFTKKLMTTAIIACVIPATPALAVVNPDPVLSRKVPSAVVALHSSQNLSLRSQFCTGTVIEKNWVLTAAHCIYFNPEHPEEISVVAKVGSTRLVRKVTMVKVHPRYEIFDETGTVNDLALLRLEEPFQSIKPIKPATPKDENSGIYAADLILYGWGTVERGSTGSGKTKGPTIPVKPRAARQVLRTPETAGISYRPEAHLPTLLTTADGLVQGSCFGDSGGPIVAHAPGATRLVGVVSYGSGDCLLAVAGVNTKVAPLWPWIAKVIKG